MRIRFTLVSLIFSLLIALSFAAYGQFSKSTVSIQINSQFPDNTTGQITPATTRTFLNNLLNSYQQYAGLNKQVGASYTIQPSDYGQLVTFNNGGAVAVTLSPANSSGYTTFNFYTQNLTIGNVVITPTGGSTICGNTSLTLANTQSAWIISDGTNYQCMFGLAGTALTTPLTVAQGGTGVSQSNFTGFDNVSGLTSTGFVLRLGSASFTTLNQVNGITLNNIAQALSFTSICNPTNVNGNWLGCTGGQMSLVLCTPTRINYTTATNSTFTTPICNGALPTQLEIEMVGGGGGGGGSGTTPAAATNGTASCWRSSSPACTTPDFQATGGLLGGTNSAGGGTGGTASANCDIGIPGGIGGGSSNNANQLGAMGGGSFFGGAGGGGAATLAGTAAATNSGSGGGGASDGATVGSGGGGGAGAYCLKVLSPGNILSSYVVTVGTHGNAGGAGGGGAAGGVGADGFITVKARWQ